MPEKLKTKEASEKIEKAIEKQIFTQIDKQITAKMQEPSFRYTFNSDKYIQSPFKRIRATHPDS